MSFKWSEAAVKDNDMSKLFDLMINIYLKTLSLECPSCHVHKWRYNQILHPSKVSFAAVSLKDESFNAYFGDRLFGIVVNASHCIQEVPGSIPQIFLSIRSGNGSTQSPDDNWAAT